MRVRRTRQLWLAIAALALVGLSPGMPAQADEIRPALLDIKEQGTGLFAVTWKVPKRGDQVVPLMPRLPDSLELVGSPSAQDVPGARVERTTYKNNADTLTGQTIAIEGLAAIQTDVLLLVQLKDGQQHSAILRPASPEFTIPLEASRWNIAADYGRMGTIHILEGVDHLLFVLALLLIVNGLGPLFTWLIAFLFGLFHGLGFAGALSEIGVPQAEVPLALLMFNVGVEVGQLLFIGAVVSVMALFRRLSLAAPAGAWRIAPYAIGSLAAFWTIQRVMSFIPD
jgi:hypothetical protein